MPNHVHLVLIPSIGSKIGPIIGEIKRILARQIHQWLKSFGSELLPRLHVTRRGALKFALWQKRCFDHNCRLEEVVWTKVKYRHDNPVNWGLVMICEEIYHTILQLPRVTPDIDLGKFDDYVF